MTLIRRSENTSQSLHCSMQRVHAKTLFFPLIHGSVSKNDSYKIGAEKRGLCMHSLHWRHFPVGVKTLRTLRIELADRAAGGRRG